MKPQAMKRKLSAVKTRLKAAKRAATVAAKAALSPPAEGAVDLTKGPKPTPRVAAPPVAQRMPKEAAKTADKKAQRNAAHSKAYKRALREHHTEPPFSKVAKLAASKAGREATEQWDKEQIVT